jgi:hypothetical protein
MFTKNELENHHAFLMGKLNYFYDKSSFSIANCLLECLPEGKSMDHL